MQNDRKRLIQILTYTGMAVILTYVIISHLNDFYGMVSSLLKALTPFAVGFVIAYVLNPLVERVIKMTKLKRGLAIASVYVGIIFILSLFINMVIPSIAEGSVQIANEIPHQVTKFSENLKKINLDNPQINSYVQGVILSVQDKLTGWANIILTNITGFFLGFTSAVMTFVFGTIVSIYALLGKTKFKKMSKQLVIVAAGDDRAIQFFEFMATVNTVFSSFISGLLVDALIVGILAFIGLSVLGVKYALIFAIVMGFTNIIPYIGPFIGAIPAVGITLLYDPFKALWVLLLIVVLQQIDANIIGPKVMGNYIGLDAIWIILAISLGGAFAGMVGMILSIPIAAILKILVGGMLTDALNRRQSKIDL